MRIIRGGRLRRLALVMSLVSALAIAGATSARVDYGSSDSASLVWLEGKPDKVTICHAAGLEGTTHYETLTIGYEAVYGPAGHFYENGTPWRDTNRIISASVARSRRPAQRRVSEHRRQPGHGSLRLGVGQGRAGQLCHAPARLPDETCVRTSGGRQSGRTVHGWDGEGRSRRQL